MRGSVVKPICKGTHSLARGYGARGWALDTGGQVGTKGGA